jgi:hypothetical protein
VAYRGHASVKGMPPLRACGARPLYLRGNRPARCLWVLPARPSRLGSPIPGRSGLCTPAKETLLPPGDHSIRPPGVPLPLVIMLCLGSRTALQSGRGDRVPPTNPPLAHSGVYHIRPSFLGAHPPGGAGSARPEGTHDANPNVASSWPLGHRQRMW